MLSGKCKEMYWTGRKYWRKCWKDKSFNVIECNRPVFTLNWFDSNKCNENILIKPFRLFDCSPRMSRISFSSPLQAAAIAFFFVLSLLTWWFGLKWYQEWYSAWSTGNTISVLAIKDHHESSCSVHLGRCRPLESNRLALRRGFDICMFVLI